MAESTVEEEQQQQQQQQPEISQEGQGQEEQQLRYLGFVQVAVLRALVCLSSLYVYAKQRSGPLRPGVQNVERTVKAFVGPVYDRVQGVPFQILKFVDSKVGCSMQKIDRHVPAIVREAQAAARTLAGDVQKTGVVATAVGLAKAAVAKYEPAARELYVRYEPAAEQKAVSAWRYLNGLPLFPQVAQILVPTAAYWSEKYNGAVSYGREKGYAVAGYLPPVPVERIAKVFGPPEAAARNGRQVVEGGGVDGGSL